jgi:ATP-dependent Clp protease, protease subunit
MVVVIGCYWRVDMTKKPNASPNTEDFEDEEEEEEEEEARQPKLLRNRAILMLSGPITQNHLGLCHELLAYHFMPEFNNPITLLINSPGGICEVGWAIIDVMNFIRLPVHTVCIGLAASMAADIFVNGDQRIMGEHSTLMIHPHSSISAGSHSKLVATLKGDMIEHNRRVQHYVTNSKYSNRGEVELNLLETKGEDLYLTPEECVYHGLADEIAISNKKTKRRKITTGRAKLLEQSSGSLKSSRSRKRPNSRTNQKPRRKTDNNK